MIDLDQLLAETPEDPPCGPDLEYDATFLELDQASRGKPEQQYGETVVPAEEPDWPQVRKLAINILQRSKDLRAAALLVRGLVSTEGFAGLKPGFDLVLGLLESYWDELHPKLDPDDDLDPMMRMNALASLADGDGLLRELRTSVLLRSRQHGQILVRDIEVALERLPAKEGSQSFTLSQLTSILASQEGLAVGPLVRDTLASAKALASALNERVGSDRAPDFRPLIATIQSILQVCGSDAAAASGESASEESIPGEAGATSPGRGTDPASAEIRNRRDALVMIDMIVEYFERYEPTNPAPLLLARAKRLMDMSFVDIIRDMAPDGLGQINTIAGIKSDDY